MGETRMASRRNCDKGGKLKTDLTAGLLVTPPVVFPPPVIIDAELAADDELSGSSAPVLEMEPDGPPSI